MSKFLRGTMILMAAGLVTRVLGFVNRIVIARFIGPEGVGLYMMAFPTLMLVITITQLGLPIAISKSVAEANAAGDRVKIKKIMTVSLAVTVTLSAILTPALIMFAPILTKTLFTDSRIYYPLIAIAPIIPIVAVSGVIRGYFQGKQNMKPFAISQVIEQLVRIFLIAVLTKAFIPYGIEFAAAGAMVASIFGELASLFYMFTMFKLKKKFRVRNKFFEAVRSGKETLYELFRVALPATGSRFIGNASWFLEPIVVAKSLAIAGVTASIATKQYGALTGFALPLLMLPSFVTQSLSTALVPAISEANSQRNHRLVESRLNQALRFSLLTGGLSVILLYVFAEPLMALMYGTSDGAQFIKIMAPFFIFQYYQGPLQATLQALDLAKAAMVNSLIGAVVKLIVIFSLTSQPDFGINGAALGIVTSMLLVTLLHYATVMKKIQFTIDATSLFLFSIVTLASGFLGHWCYDHMFQAYTGNYRLLIGIFMTSFIYLSLLLLTKQIRRNDLKRIPFIKKLI
jgi:stage V sporulation protein B